MREGRDASGRRLVNVRVIAPSENSRSAAAWILKHDPQNTDHLIKLGHADARRMPG